ncbi:MAG: hypothetical protein Q8922_12575 [Bacteroidota bacterium]|nr:hypothetical protein [Bacteroidota bacterium]MDP4288759.1 hypothetical protein [Bacteroidota bacterium]
MPVLRNQFGLERFAQVNLSLILISLILSLTGIIYLYRLLRLLPISEVSVQVTTLIYAVSQCVMNYGMTGTSYMSGISILIAGLYYVFDSARRLSVGLSLWAAGVLLAIAPLLWMPYILALPAAILVYPTVNGWNRKNLVESLRLTMVVALVALAILVPFVVHLHLTPAGFVQWALDPGDKHYMAGPLRTVFGLPKTLFYLGNDGLYVKRFLYHDPYHPVSALMLFGLGLWKMGLFYSLLLVIFVVILRDLTARKYLVFLLVGIIPNLILSFRWDGAALERHLPLMPFLFIALALGFAYGSTTFVRPLIGAVGLVVLVLNVSAMWPSVSAEAEARGTAHIREIWPRLNDHSIVTVLNIQDELVVFQRIHPLNPYNQSHRLCPYPVLGSVDDSSRYWRERFEHAKREAWMEHGGVWVKKSLLASAPDVDDYWIENERPGISWKNISNYFRQQYYSDSTDTFLLLQPDQP